jgi:hypothetical protein
MRLMSPVLWFPFEYQPFEKTSGLPSGPICRHCAGVLAVLLETPQDPRLSLDVHSSQVRFNGIPFVRCLGLRLLSG